MIGSLEKGGSWEHRVCTVRREQRTGLRARRQRSQKLLQRLRALHAEQRQVHEVRVAALQGCLERPLLPTQAQQ